MQCILGWQCSPVEYVEQFDGEGGVDPESAPGPGVVKEGVDGLETEHDGLEGLHRGGTAHRLHTDT